MNNKREPEPNTRNGTTCRHEVDPLSAMRVDQRDLKKLLHLHDAMSDVDSDAGGNGQEMKLKGLFSSTNPLGQQAPAAASAGADEENVDMLDAGGQDREREHRSEYESA